MSLGKKKNFISYFILTLCAFLALYICFFKLGAAALDNWDEAWYADVTRHMLNSKEFFVLYWNRLVFLDKPPLYMWFSAVTAKIIGLSEFSIRFPSALSGFITIIIVILYSYSDFGLIPALISFSTLAFNNLFIWRARSGNLDSLLTLLFVLFYFLVISKEKKYLLIGFVLGLIYLTKLTIVLFPLLVFIILEIIYENKKLYFNIPNYLKLLFIFVITAGVWLYLGSIKIGPNFYRYFLFHADQGVSNISLANLKLDYLSYAYYSLQRRFFWLVLLGIILALTKLKNKKYFAQIIFAGGLLIQLSFTAKNNNWYLLPAIPFWSMLAAMATFNLFKLFKKIRFGFIIIIIFSSISSYISFKTFTVNIIPIINAKGPETIKNASIKLKKLTNNDDVIVRLDHLYPTTIYYSDRHVLSSPDGASNSELFISREQLKKRIQLKEISWLVGKTDDATAFLKSDSNHQYRIIEIGEETILHAL
ncbi:MAG TPA: glycosyltransferase family 39 protein [Patescibacteria group bacterium]